MTHAVVGLLAWVALAVAGPSAPAGDAACVGLEPAEIGGERLLAEAVAVLRASGHDPADFRVSLRLEDPLVGFVALGRAPRPGVLFTPRVAGPSVYPLRVSTLQPCVAAWALDLAAPTPGQRRVLEIAAGLLDPAPAGDEVLQVLESATHYQVEVWYLPPGQGAPLFSGRSVRIRKEPAGSPL